VIHFVLFEQIDVVTWKVLSSLHLVFTLRFGPDINIAFIILCVLTSCRAIISETEKVPGNPCLRHSTETCLTAIVFKELTVIK
jgi:hypothetical protein